MKKKVIVTAIISSLVLPLVGCGDNGNDQLTTQQKFERQQKLDEYQHEERMQLLKNQAQTQYHAGGAVASQQDDSSDVYASNDDTSSVPQPVGGVTTSTQQPQQFQSEQYDGESNVAAPMDDTTTTQQADSGYGVGSMVAGVATGAALGALASHMWSKKTDSHGNVHYFENGKEKSASDYKSFMQRAKEKAKSAVSKTKTAGSALAAKTKVVGATAINKARTLGTTARNKFATHKPSFVRHAHKVRNGLSGFASRASHKARSFGSRFHRRR